MFDFGQIPTWLRRATWDWSIVRHVRSKKSLSKVPRRVPELGVADLQEESRGSEVYEASDRRIEFPYCNDSYSCVMWSFFLIVLSVFAFAYVVFSSYGMVYRDLFVSDVGGYSLLIHVASFSVFVICLAVAAYALLLVIPSFFHLFFRVIGKRRRHAFTFDRERGVVILPPIAFGAYDEVPWESLVIVNFYMPKLYGGSFKVIKAFRPSDLRLITLNEDFPDEAMAFYSWYMDRSKPLPPDEVFDPYRERDEERRLREYGPEVVRQFPASLTGPGTRLATRMGMVGAR